jgi:CBS domain-containing protein
MKISDVMTRAPKCCVELETLDRAAQRMWEADCGFLPVLNDTGDLVGTVTDRDVCMAAWTQGRPLSELRATLVARRPVFTVHETDSVEAAELLMLRKQVRRLPVLGADGKLVGVISLSDLARRIDAPVSGKGGAINKESVAQTLAGICRVRGDVSVATAQMTPPPPPPVASTRRRSATS